MRFTRCLPLTLLAMCGLSRADFKYTQQSKITGGSIVSMTKTLGVFSKNARQLTDPQVSTMSLKGNRLRQEHSDGTVEIIDLDGRRFIRIDPAKKTYSTMTFEEFKAALERAQARAKEEQAKAAAKHPEAADYKIVPKMQSQETGATRTNDHQVVVDIQVPAGLLECRIGGDAGAGVGRGKALRHPVVGKKVAAVRYDNVRTIAAGPSGAEGAGIEAQ